MPHCGKSNHLRLGHTGSEFCESLFLARQRLFKRQIEWKRKGRGAKIESRSCTESGVGRGQVQHFGVQLRSAERVGRPAFGGLVMGVGLVSPSRAVAPFVPHFATAVQIGEA